MKKVVIIGGGIAGMTAGILLQKAGYETEIFEKHEIVGGQCTGWKREGYVIDNCIHWLTGTKEGSTLNDLWKEIGALGEGIDVYQKEMFFSSKLDGQTLTYWQDPERTRKEMLKISPQDAKEINKLIDYVKIAESFVIPVEKPLDTMNLWELMKLGLSMKGMRKVMKEYGGIGVDDLALRFKHPLLQRSITDCMPPGYQAFTFVVSYATITSGNGGIPRGGSLEMAMRILKKYQENGGVIHTNAAVEQILIDGKKGQGIILQDGRKIVADYVVCSCDTDYTFRKLLPCDYMPKGLKKQYENRAKYPVNSGFQVAYAIDGVFSDLTGIRVFSCEEIKVATNSVKAMSIASYDYEPDFAPKGKMIIQSNFNQTEADYEYWKDLYTDKSVYERKKKEIAQQSMERLVAEYPCLEGKVKVLDVWTPITYTRYCNSYQGAYMSFVATKNSKSITVPGVIGDVDNVFLASQWLMGPGGLPVAAAMGKFAAWRIIKND